MSMDGKLNERWGTGSYRYVCIRRIIEVLKIVLGSVQSENEAT